MTDPGRYAGLTTLVTGASGILGSWLVHRLLADGATVVALVRDEDPRSQLWRSGDIARIARVRGSLEDPSLLERILVEYEVDTIFHLGAQTQVRHAQTTPVRDAGGERSRNLQPAGGRSSHPCSLAGDRGRLQRQGLRRLGRLAIHRGPPARGPQCL